MRLLVFGGWGQLGADLFALAERRHDVLRPRSTEVDVSDGQAVGAWVRDSRADVVLNLAAFHKVELCEEDPVRAFAVNSLGALYAARAARSIGARSLYVSTDYVFDGERSDGYREGDPARPLNIYGVSKAAGELAVRAADPDALVVRGSGLFGHAGSAGKGGNFVDNMIARARAGEALSIVDDQIFAPTATRDMAERILLMLERRAPPGVYHAANAGSCSWFDLAKLACEMAGIDADITPRPTGEGPVRRPRYSVLLDTKSVRLGLPPNRTWQEALAWYLANRPRSATTSASAGVP